MKQYTCKSLDRRGKSTTSLMQSGYKPGTREPDMVPVTTEWSTAVACGYLARASDPLCGDCPNRSRENGA